MTTRKLPGALILCAGLMLGACGDSAGPDGTGGTTLVGTWDLTHLNGVALPIVETTTFNDTTWTYTFQSMHITFNAYDTFSYTQTAHSQRTGKLPQNLTDTRTGTWSTSGDTLTLTEPFVASLTANFNISGTVLTITITDRDPDIDPVGDILRFQRR